MCREQIFIENERLLIHGLRDQDLDGLTAMRNDPRIYRYEPTFLIELQGTPEEALRAIQGMDLFEDRQCILGIYEKNDPDALAGLAEFYDFKPSGKVISIGCRLRPEYWSMGLGTNCAQLLVDFIKKNTEVELITAHVITDNKYSPRPLLKNGFKLLVTKPDDWGHDSKDVAGVYTLEL